MAKYQSNTSEAAIHFKMGNAYKMQEQYQDALAAFNNAIAAKPDFAAGYYAVGQVYYELEKYAEALAAFKKVVVIEPIGFFADTARRLIRGIEQVA